MNELKNVTTYPAILGAVIARLRSEKCLTQADLAEAVGLQPSTWSRIEKGESALTVEQLRLAALRMDETPAYIMELAEEAILKLPTTGISLEMLSRAAWTGTAAAIGAGFLPVVGSALGAVVGQLLGHHLQKNKTAEKN